MSAVNLGRPSVIRLELVLQLFVSVAVTALGVFIAANAAPSGLGWTFGTLDVSLAPMQFAIATALGAGGVLLAAAAVSGLVRLNRLGSTGSGF